MIHNPKEKIMYGVTMHNTCGLRAYLQWSVLDCYLLILLTDDQHCTCEVKTEDLARSICHGWLA